MSDGPDPQAVRRMFARVAWRYDLANRLLSLGQDQRWRRALRRQVDLWAPPGPVLDLATGTGDVALGFAKRAVVGSDFCLEMLLLARRKGRGRGYQALWLAADAGRLPFRDEAFAAVTVAFGLRNFPDRQHALREIYRVLAESGVLAVLEFHPIENPLARALHRFWQRVVIEPVGGWLSGDREAYRYLPHSSRQFLTCGQLAVLAGQVGFHLLSSRSVGFRVAALSVFRKGGGT